MNTDFGNRTIVVNGTKIEVNVTAEGELLVDDLDTDMARVASQMGWWASCCAAAEREAAEAEAHYRRWHGQAFLDVLAKDPKLSVDKVKAHIEADDQFLRLKTALAKAQENVVLTTKMFVAFEMKGKQLQSRGARERAERERYGMTTPERSEDRREVMREQNRDKKKRKG